MLPSTPENRGEDLSAEHFHISPMNRTWRILTALFSAGVLGMAGYQLVLAAFHFDLREEYALEDGMLTGHPHWRFFQNRILAPSIFGVIRHAMDWQTSRAYKVTCILLLSLFYLTLACCLWNLTKTPRTVVFGLLGAALNGILLIHTSWIYLWDPADLTIFCLLVWALLSSQRVWVLALIIGVEIFNREIALILASLLLIDGFLRRCFANSNNVTRQDLVLVEYIMPKALRAGSPN